MQDMTITFGELAARLGLAEGTLRNKYATLVAAGMPARVPGGRTFFRPAIEAWLADAAGMAPSTPTDPLQAHRDFLDSQRKGRAA